jgi:hypothetical protein
MPILKLSVISYPLLCLFGEIFLFQTCSNYFDFYFPQYEKNSEFRRLFFNRKFCFSFSAASAARC